MAWHDSGTSFVATSPIDVWPMQVTTPNDAPAGAMLIAFVHSQINSTNNAEYSIAAQGSQPVEMITGATAQSTNRRLQAAAFIMPAAAPGEAQELVITFGRKITHAVAHVFYAGPGEAKAAALATNDRLAELSGALQMPAPGQVFYSAQAKGGNTQIAPVAGQALQANTTEADDTNNTGLAAVAALIDAAALGQVAYGVTCEPAQQALALAVAIVPATGDPGPDPDPDPEPPAPTIFERLLAHLGLAAEDRPQFVVGNFTDGTKNVIWVNPDTGDFMAHQFTVGNVNDLE